MWQPKNFGLFGQEEKPKICIIIIERIMGNIAECMKLLPMEFRYKLQGSILKWISAVLHEKVVTPNIDISWIKIVKYNSFLFI